MSVFKDIEACVGCLVQVILVSSSLSYHSSHHSQSVRKTPKRGLSVYRKREKEYI